MAITKQELMLVRNIKSRLIEQLKKIKNLRASVKDLVSPLSDMPRSLNVRNRVEVLALKIVDAERVLSELREQFSQAKLNLVEKIITEVEEPNVQQLVLLRYVKCLPFKKIAKNMEYSLRHTFRLHEKFFKCHIDVTRPRSV